MLRQDAVTGLNADQDLLSGRSGGECFGGVRYPILASKIA
jgi:hypothetical protein